MPKFNIYKIAKSKQSSLTQKLEAVGLKQSVKKSINKCTLTFYFDPVPEGTNIWWVDFFSDFISDDLSKIKNRCYYGALIVEYQKHLFAISFGKSHFYLQEFAEIDFGVDLGTRIIDDKSIDLKNTKLFGGVKKKSITAYRSKTNIDIDSGESIAFLKGESINRKKWGNKVSCGTSVQLSLPLTHPKDLSGLIIDIVKVLKTSPRFRIPRANEVKSKAKKERLEEKLAEAINQGLTMLSVEEQSVSGVEFIFQKDYELCLISNRKKYCLNDGTSIIELKNYILDSGLKISKENLSKIKVRAKDFTGKGFTKNIKYFLDYIDDDNYFLDQGIWSHFNQDYLNFLYKSVDQLTIQCDEDLNFAQNDFDTFLSKISEKEKSKWYAERFFNEKVADEFDCLDRDMSPWGSNKVEVCDLLKNNEIYAVKIGQPQKLCYAIDQSLTSLKYIQQNKGFSYKNQTIKPEKIGLWLVLERKSKLKKLSEIRSITFLMKLNNWRKKVVDAGYEAVVKVNYKLKKQ